MEKSEARNFREENRDISPLGEFNDDDRREFWASLALKYCKGIGARTIARLLGAYGSAYASMANSEKWPRLGINPVCVQELSSGRWRVGARKEWDKAMALDAMILLWTNPLYPELLRQIPDAPAYLYLSGDPRLLSPASVAIVGSRAASPEGLANAERLGQSLSAAGITVVSGMASGIDSRAHEGALKEVGGSVGVLGAGIDIVYPWSNKRLFSLMREKGLLISEFAPGSPPINYNFPVRNRLISGLSLGVAVVEAAERSGSLVTAKIAIDQNREVFAIPGAPFNNRSKGCQNLIRMGAHSIFGIEDILNNLSGNLESLVSDYRKISAETEKRALDLSSENGRSSVREFGVSANKPPSESAPEISPETAEKISGMDKSEAILRVLRDRESWQADDLAFALNMSAQELNAVLIIMEIQGKIKRLNGASYAAID